MIDFRNRKIRVFVSYASEDRKIVERIVDRLLRHGLDVWFDAETLTVGDTIDVEIDRGIAACDFAVVVLSKAFFRKGWPRRELSGLVTREAAEQRVLILPVWHDIRSADVLANVPTLAAKVAIRTTEGAEGVAHQLCRAIEKCVKYTVETNRDVITPPEDFDYLVTTLASWEEELANLFHKEHRTAAEQERLASLWAESERILGIGE